MTPDSPRLRLGILGIVIVSLFAALFARLWFLQVLASPTYRVQAESNRVRLVQEQAPRGRILDRHGRVIVTNRVSMIVTVNRREMEEAGDRDDVIYRLAGVLARTQDDIEKRLADPRYNAFQPVPVAEDVDEGAIIVLREHKDDYPGVDVRRVAVRQYPYGPLAAHLLGHVGEINAEEMDGRNAKIRDRDEQYQLGDSIGKSGVERVYEDDLRGAPGIRKLEVDSGGNALRTLAYQPPVPGDDLQLTVDLDIQALAEQSLAQSMERARGRRSANASHRTYNAPAGAAVVLDPRNGAVLAMASQPTYDPREFVNGISTEAFARLNDPAGHFPLNNRAIQGQYAPGSTFKLVTGTAGLRSGLIAANSTIRDGGVYRIPSCTGKCEFRNAGGRAYGSVAVQRALTVSSDVFFYDLGYRFWENRGTYGDAIQAAAVDYGLGAETGVPLPSEQEGRVPTPESRARLYDANPGKYLERNWFPGDNVNLAIGQGEMAVTPLQLANAYATFANGGTVFSPNVAAAVLGDDGKPVRELAPRVLKKMDLPPHVRQPILDGLLGVTGSGEGTARSVFIGFPLELFPVAGKTGTAEVNTKDDTALFSAFGPAANPQWVVTVIIEEAGFGTTAAAPVARQIFDAVAGVTPLASAQPVPELSGLPAGGKPVADPAPTTGAPPPVDVSDRGVTE